MLKWNYVYVQQTFVKVRFRFCSDNFFEPDKLGCHQKLAIKSKPGIMKLTDLYVILPIIVKLFGGVQIADIVSGDFFVFFFFEKLGDIIPCHSLRLRTGYAKRPAP